MHLGLTVSFLLLTPATAVASPSREALAAFAEEQMPRMLEKHRLAGAVISLIAEGEVVFAKGYGQRDREAQLPVDPERTLFRVGSISKLFVWTAVMQCVERGLIDLDADVNRYLDGFAIPATFPEPVTMTQLMNHAPGFEDQLLGLFETRAERLRGLAEAMRDVPKRVDPPGQYASYSNYGAALAAYIVERVTGVPFERYVDENIFAPLGMQHSTFAQPVPAPLLGELSRGYELRGEALVPAPFEFVSGVYPAGSLSSTATDMARFLRAHLAGGTLDGQQILAPQTAARMHTRSFGDDPRFSGMAHGFMLAPTGGGTMLYHGGDTVFFHSLAFIFPEQKVGLFVSTNSSGGSLAVIELGKAFLARFFRGEIGLELAKGFAAPAPAERFVGTYLTRRRSESDLARLVALAMPVGVAADPEGGLSVSSFMSAEPVRYVQIGPNLFRQRDGDDQLRFFDGADGEVESAVLGLMPVMTFSRPAFADQPLLAAAIVVTALLLLLSSLVLPPTGLVALLRRRSRQVGEARLAARTGLALALLYVSFFITLAASLSGGMLALLSDSTARRVALVLPYLGAVLGLACLVFAVRAWRQHSWGLLSRVHYTALAVSTLALFWFLAHWHVLA